jgi:hypothetical protein
MRNGRRRSSFFNNFTNVKSAKLHLTVSLLFFLFSRPDCRAQESNTLVIITGQIVAEKSLTPVSYANIEVLETTHGTVADELGKFTLKIPRILYRPGLRIKISCIGYKTAIKPITSPLEFLQISLLEDLRMLKTVTIEGSRKDSSAVTLVNRALNNIERNYPLHSERLEGYFEESLYTDSLYTKPIYLAEAVIEIHKETYSKKVRQGDVKLLKGRKFVVTDLDSAATKIIGGVHNPHRFDFVHRREAPFNKEALRNYKFSIVDTVFFDNLEIVVISFNPLGNMHGSGKLYISSDSYAVIRGEFYYQSGEENILESGSMNLRGVNRIYRHYRTEYFFQDSSWRLKLAQYQTAFATKSDTIHLKNSFATTAHYRVTEKIPYIERFQYNYVLVDSANSNDDNFWDRYNVVPTPYVQQRISIQKLQANKSDTGMGRSIGSRPLINRFSASMSVFTYRTKYSNLNVDFSQPTIQLRREIEAAPHYYFGLTSSLQYNASERFVVGLENSSAFDGNFSLISLEFGLKNNLAPGKRPVYLDPSITLGLGRHRIPISNFNNPGKVELKNKTFDSDEINVFYQSQGNFVTPSLSLMLEKSATTLFFIGAYYRFYFETQAGLFLREKESILMRKSTFLKNGTEGVNLQSNSRATFSNGMGIRFGLVLRAR